MAPSRFARGLGLSRSEAAGIVLLAVPVSAAIVLAFKDGGYFVSSWGVASVILWGALAAGLILLGPRLGGWAGLAGLAGMVVLAVWQGISADRAFEPSAAIQAMNMTLLYAAVFGLGLVGVRSRVSLRLLSSIVLAGVSIVALYGVGARLLPGLIGDDRLARLNVPISYWNAQGALFALGIVLGIGLAGTPSMLPWLRALAIAPVPLLGFGLYLTLSRGGILLLLVCLVLVVALAPGRIETTGVMIIAAGAAIPLVVLANSRGDLTALEGILPAHQESGRLLALLLVGATAGAAVLAWAFSHGTLRLGLKPRRILGATLGALVVIIAVGGYVAKGPEVGPVSWADRQFESFKSYGSNDRTDASLESQIGTAAGTGRWQNWSVAAEEFRSEPLTGTGAGDFRFWWNQSRPIGQYVVNAHSLYLEVLAEAGLVGLALLMLPLVGALAILVAVLLRRDMPALKREVVVASAAALLIVLHAAGDWDWQLPAVMIPAFLLGAGALKAGAVGLDLDRPFGLWVPAGAAALAVLAALLVSGPVTSQVLVDRAKAQARDGKLIDALQTARQAEDADPNSPTARLVSGYVLTDLGRGNAADQAFADALMRSSRDWSILADWAGSLIARDQIAAARPLVERARSLNPREKRVAVLEQFISGKGD